MYVNFSSCTNIDRIAKMTKTWQTKRINAINRKISRVANKRAMTENYIDEHWRICNSQASNKEEYKAECEHQANDYYNACME
tara:strand:+ start:126 stop:371 length:246 start_codon:yes stop_codon:yes gene_type:complete